MYYVAQKWVNYRDTGVSKNNWRNEKLYKRSANTYKISIPKVIKYIR